MSTGYYKANIINFAFEYDRVCFMQATVFDYFKWPHILFIFSSTPTMEPVSDHARVMHIQQV